MAILHPALRLLLRKQLKARWRRFKRGASTTRGKLRLIAVSAVLALGLTPLVFVGIFLEPTDDPTSSRAMVASGLFLLTIITVLGQGQDAGIVFSPSEVDFLFPAPFSRRDLLIYRLATFALGALFSAAFFSLFALTYTTHVLFAFLGFALGVQFIQLVSMSLGLTISIVGQTAYTRGRKIGLAALGILVVAGIVQAGGFSGDDGGVAEWTRQFASTPVGSILLAPAQVYAAAITAKSFIPGFAGWALVGAMINVALIGVLLRLDANFLERSAATSQKAYLKLQRLRAGQGWLNLSKPTASRWRLPMLSRWKGAGPIAWRQTVSAMRGSKGILYFLAIVLGIMGFSMGSMPEVSVARIMTVFLPMMTVTFLPQMLRFDFRGDFDRFETLKTLPASSLAIAVGELIAPTVFATMIEAPCVLAIGMAEDQWQSALVVAAFLPVLNLFIFAVENLVFLWYPQRPAAAAEFSGMGQRMLTTMVKVLAVLVVAGVSALAGALFYWALIHSWPAALAASWLFAAACALAILPLLARAFERLDPSSIPAS